MARYVTHSSNRDNLVEVVDVHMHKYSVEAGKDLLAGGDKRLWEGSAWRGGNGVSNA